MKNQPPPPALTPANLATQAHAGTPQYGRFGLPQPDGSKLRATRRHYVGGYVDPTGEHGGCPTLPTNPDEQRGHVMPNQAPAAVRAAQGADEEVARAAYALDDPRYAGGDPYASADEQTGF